MRDLAILYEHPAWFAPLFAALDRRGIDYVALKPDGAFDPADLRPPAKVVFNRIAMSSFLRGAAHEHPIFHTMALLDHWSRAGARVINGPEVLALDCSKARQLSLIASLGLSTPVTRVVHRAEDIVPAAQSMSFPIVVKANIGGSGAGISRFDNLSELQYAVSADELPSSVDGVLLIQDYVPARGGIVTRIETLDRSYLYALDIVGGGSFDLCPADACADERGALSLEAVDPAPDLRKAAERIAHAMNLDVGGIEVMVDTRDGVPRFYDINALSNFVGKPIDVLGYDPHDQLVDYLVTQIEKVR